MVNVACRADNHRRPGIAWVGTALVAGIIHAMVRSQIEFEIREPTGLRLGTYDIFTIRQKIYTGELQPRCEYLTSHGAWAPLEGSALFDSVLWLRHLEVGTNASLESEEKTAPRIAGWSTSSAPATASSGSPSPSAGHEAGQKKKGLLSRFFGKS